MRSPSGREIPDEIDPVLEELVRGIIGQVADKWTMLILEVLEEHGTLRFTQIGKLTGGISQKMLTQTLRQMERDGFVSRKVYPVIPPKVEYSLTELGRSLSAAFCTVWEWAAARHADIEAARKAFEERNGKA
ncbi:helix-turn-helix domain-containing protein [Neorhizobium galegae]|uniref:winged helix-turn-helix transcriptional regulator n=1 Tax=Neorhizobium galegae TaxID=399 RepID=UPI0006228419|nr:helix-turn-helix domain-containing protein [Neorhizobium galegae]CDZ29533.1 Putative transcriptional regulator [Neorhizobium galegae bv. officinalis]KAA9386282.1 helix-turn-helix transcriptional regulator [Neorhizobium galegae]KAB1112892.1 helix-turn-helix transcriptional regulator [Neorhizobium galegae]MCM2500688.1 helix-turn-helix transcriptional regulator [Neorhizobium galegae]MCQ1770647.1 helix-turn-helix transcriptional regulator [Neorhizobium galegae]